ncbi:LysE family transporter [candidate division KSB1 bacterium]|nr:LysE family transporter [candidate division KSB1 bacterium]
MALIPFLAQTVLISLSGVMAPGALTAVTIGKGTTSPRAGSWIAIGHGIFEVPLILAIFFGFGSLFNIPSVKLGLLIVGGLILAWMGIDMLKSMRVAEVKNTGGNRSPVVTGIVLSAGNPYFLIWWATIGAALIFQAVEFGWVGLSLFIIFHWLCDLIWLTILSTISFKGGHLFGTRFQQIVFGICGSLLILFSIKFIWNGIQLI